MLDPGSYKLAPTWKRSARGLLVTVEVETERAHPQDERGQGDIISIEYPDGQTGPEIGLVINADCDLANGKIDGTIAYLPIYSFREFLALFWVPGYLKSIANESAIRLVDITKAGASGGDDLNLLLEQMPEEEAITRLCGLSGVKPKDHKAIEGHVHKIAICRDEGLAPYSRFERLCRLHKDPQKHARSLIEGARNTMGEGHFFVSDLIGRQELGFVIRMRRIYSLPEENVFTSVAAQRAGSGGDQVTAIRFARLQPLYRFRVLQLFAHQFSRIGLPDQVTALSVLAVDDLVANIVEA